VESQFLSNLDTFGLETPNFCLETKFPRISGTFGLLNYLETQKFAGKSIFKYFRHF